MGWMGVLREGAMGRRLGWTGVMGAWLLALGLSSGVAGEVAPDGADAAAAEVGVAEVGAAIAAHDHVRCLASRSAEAAEAGCRASLEAFRERMFALRVEGADTLTSLAAWNMVVETRRREAAKRAASEQAQTDRGPGPDLIPDLDTGRPSSSERPWLGDFPPHRTPLARIPRLIGFFPSRQPPALAHVREAAEELRRCMTRALHLNRVPRFPPGETWMKPAGRFCAPFLDAFAQDVQRAGLAPDMVPVTVEMAWPPPMTLWSRPPATPPLPSVVPRPSPPPGAMPEPPVRRFPAGAP